MFLLSKSYEPTLRCAAIELHSAAMLHGAAINGQCEQGMVLRRLEDKTDEQEGRS